MFESSFSAVLFPAPLCPMMPTASPDLTPKLRSRRAQNSPGPFQSRPTFPKNPGLAFSESFLIR
jgi:hypothetical protein